MFIYWKVCQDWSFPYTSPCGLCMDAMHKAGMDAIVTTEQCFCNRSENREYMKSRSIVLLLATCGVWGWAALSARDAKCCGLLSMWWMEKSEGKLNGRGTRLLATCGDLYKGKWPFDISFFWDIQNHHHHHHHHHHHRVTILTESPSRPSLIRRSQRNIPGRIQTVQTAQSTGGHEIADEEWGRLKDWIVLPFRLSLLDCECVIKYIRWCPPRVIKQSFVFLVDVLNLGKNIDSKLEKSQQRWTFKLCRMSSFVSHL